MTDENKLEFTGERFTPECVREIWYEHYHRYAFAKKIIVDKNVLDIACGEGYGSYILSQKAKSVIGMDIDAKSVEHAEKKYKNANLAYRCGSCLNIDMPDNSVDVVISFETLEHLAEQQQMLSEFNRVLADEGVIVISTPDKKHYSDATGFTNEYHVKELYKDEFKALLDVHWQNQMWYSQALSFNSLMQKMDSTHQGYSSDILANDKYLEDENLIKSMYYVVVASKQKVALPLLPDLHLFADEEQSIYAHYNEVIRNVINYGEQLNKINADKEKINSHRLLAKLIRFLERIALKK